MTTTILAVIALTAPLAPATTPGIQAQTDYAQARKLAASEKKPMLVLIGKGDAFARVAGDAGLTAEARKVLAEKYVCVTVNTETEAGKDLAGDFEMADGGLVISSAGGTHQALRQSGAVSASDLAKHATSYANVSTTPAGTVTTGAPVVPASYAAPVYPAPAFNAPVYGTPVISGGYPGGSFGGVGPAGYSFPVRPAFGCSGGT